MIGQTRSAGLIEFCAIGIGHNVCSYYPVARRIDQVGKLADAVVDILDELWWPSGRLDGAGSIGRQ